MNILSRHPLQLRADRVCDGRVQRLSDRRPPFSGLLTSFTQARRQRLSHRQHRHRRLRRHHQPVSRHHPEEHEHHQHPDRHLLPRSNVFTHHFGRSRQQTFFAESSTAQHTGQQAEAYSSRRSRHQSDLLRLQCSSPRKVVKGQGQHGYVV